MTSGRLSPLPAAPVGLPSFLNAGPYMVESSRLGSKCGRSFFILGFFFFVVVNVLKGAIKRDSEDFLAGESWM